MMWLDEYIVVAADEKTMFLIFKMFSAAATYSQAHKSNGLCYNCSNVSKDK